MYQGETSQKEGEKCRDLSLQDLPEFKVKLECLRAQQTEGTGAKDKRGGGGKEKLRMGDKATS